jgi:hypothetical protein
MNQAYDFADDIVTPVLNECIEIYSLTGNSNFEKNTVIFNITNSGYAQRVL